MNDYDYVSVYDAWWMSLAACRGTDPEAFYPPEGGHSYDARRVCRACPVRAACLEYALEHDEYGIWGGLSESHRARLKAVRRELVSP